MLFFSGLMQKLFNQSGSLLVGSHCKSLETAADISIKSMLLIVISLNIYPSVQQKDIIVIHMRHC